MKEALGCILTMRQMSDGLYEISTIPKLREPHSH